MDIHRESKIICKSSMGEPLEVTVVSEWMGKMIEKGVTDVSSLWFTTDNQSEVGEMVVIENSCGARINRQRIK